MESKNSQDNGTFTWCPICENQVSEKYKDTEKLLDHIRTSHPPVIQENHLNVNQVLLRILRIEQYSRKANPLHGTSLFRPLHLNLEIKGHVKKD